MQTGRGGFGLLEEGERMRFEVPAGSALVFSGADGSLLAEPLTQPLTRVVQAETPEV